MKLLLSLCFLLISIIQLSSQCTPAAADNCEDANILCSLDELNGYTCQNPDYSNPTGCSPLCPSGGGAHNTAWWAFVTEGGSVCLTLSFNFCTVNGTGVQFGIWGDCECAQSIFCDPSCTGPGQKVACGVLEPCKIYYLFVDGCTGDVCDFTITTVGGKSPKSVHVTDIIGKTEICLSECVTYEAILDNQNCSSNFEWSIDGVEILDKSSKKISIEVAKTGSFVLCSKAIIGNKESGSICSSSVPYCKTITVKPIETVRAKDELICEYKLPFYWNNCLVSQAGDVVCRTKLSNCCLQDSVKKFILIPDNMQPCDEYPYIKGRIYYDNDNNNMFSQGDIMIDKQLVTESNSNFSGISVLGNYTLELPKNSENEVRTIPFDKKWYKVEPEFYKVKSNNVPGQIQGNYDFAIQYLQVADLEISVSGIRARSGQTTQATIVVSNYAPIGVGSTKVNFKFPSNWTFQSSSLINYSINQNNLSWNIKTPDYGQTIIITVALLVDPKDPASKKYEYEATVENQGDINLQNNKALFCDIIRNSQDPNDKLVNYEFIPESYTDRHHEITYTIRFQNVGNDVAYNIFILDTLHKFLDPLSLRFKSSSHPCKMLMKRMGFIRFEFDNINLPDTSVSQVESQGYVQYSVRPKNGVENGSIITNSADIYFDQNSGIVTNQVSTKVIVTNVNNSSKDSKFNIYPNPVSDELFVHLPSEINSKYQLEIVNLNGKKMLSQGVKYSDHVIMNVKSIPNGVYVLNIINEGIKLESIRFLKY